MVASLTYTALGHSKNISENDIEFVRRKLGLNCRSCSQGRGPTGDYRTFHFKGSRIVDELKINRLTILPRENISDEDLESLLLEIGIVDYRQGVRN